MFFERWFIQVEAFVGRQMIARGKTGEIRGGASSAEGVKLRVIVPFQR
jgi:hypothetical protein